jgi:hypothetical protein
LNILSSVFKVSGNQIWVCLAFAEPPPNDFQRLEYWLVIFEDHATSVIFEDYILLFTARRNDSNRCRSLDSRHADACCSLGLPQSGPIFSQTRPRRAFVAFKVLL